MGKIICNGCFDVFHVGHESFLLAARNLGGSRIPNDLIVAVNTDESAKRLKAKKWGERYPIDSWEKRAANVSKYADTVVGFDTEDDLHQLIEWNMPCILVKGPDYAGKAVTGDDLAPVIILDTPEPESVKEMKRKVYALEQSR